jgi:DNA-binding HxlR family transcriptional regulator
MARKRPYDQYCGLAAALEVIGDRWTPLIIRELAIGTRRFREIADGLPGIPEDVLSARLKQLATDDVIERAGPGRNDGYRLTPHGRELLPALGALASWGAHHLDPEPRDDQCTARRALSAMALGFDPSAAVGVDAVVELVVDGESARLRVADGAFEPVPSDAPADVTITTDTASAFAIGRGRSGGTTTVTGDESLAPTTLAMFRFPRRARGVPADGTGHG